MDQVRSGYLSPLLRRQRMKAAIPFLRGRVLDVGCGTGALAQYCDPRHYLGIDIDEASLATARHAHPEHRFERDLPTGELLFDTIVALAVIEHVPSPGVWLAQLARLLIARGRIIVTTPYPSFEWCHTFGARIGLFSKEASEEHENLLYPTLMATLADAAGLQLVLQRRFLIGANQLFVMSRPQSP
jgi:2-polyprenyl-3-methyl-5-hydroxy-6-metoxy-1,4-benzoquinol methylase